MKNQVKLFLILLVGLPITTSCGKNETAGPVTTETRSLIAFDEVEIRGDFEVQIEEGGNFELEITAPQNVLPYIETHVTDNLLVIDELNNRIRDTKLQIRISNSALKRLELNGSGKISGVSISSPKIEISLSGSGLIDIPIDCEESNIDLSGSGRIKFFGTSPKVNYSLSGSGSISATAIECQNASAHLSGSGNIQLFTSDTLFATISGSGSLQYFGDPEFVSTNVSGSGSINHQ